MTMPKDKQKIELTKKMMSIVRKGKTWEEIFGEEKAKEMKLKKAKWFKENNPGRNPREETKKRMSIAAKKRCEEDRGSFFREGNILSPESKLKHSEARRKWCLEHKDLFRKRLRNTKQNNPGMSLRGGIRCTELKTIRGISPQEELIMKELLPIDFLHNIRLGNTVPDFHSPERKIVIEVDGIHHKYGIKKEKDIEHNQLWKSKGYKVFRFSNKGVNEYMKPLLGGMI